MIRPGQQASLVIALASASLLSALVDAAPLEAAEPAVEPARFHHVQLNVTNPKESIKFYSRVFGATPVKFRGVSDALAYGDMGLALPILAPSGVASGSTR